jgi:histone demethylase JARID1
VVCLDHIGNVDWPLEDEEYTMVLRYTTADLEQTAQRVKDRALLPQAWAEKLRAATEDIPKPQLKTLRSLLTEGERIPWNLPRLPDLKKFVEKCNEWVEEAQGYITRKQSRRKSEKSSRKSGAAKAAEAEEKEKEFRKLSNIKRLLNDADHIGFECPEIQTLQERADTITDYQKKARDALATILDQKSTDLEELIEVGKSYALEIPEIDNLEKVLKQLQWIESARSTVPGRTLHDVEVLIKQSADVNVPDHNEDLVFLKEQKSRGESWEAKAQELMAADQIHYAQLDSFAKQAAELPVNKDTLAAVDAILRKQRETQELITGLLEKCRSADISQRPSYKDVRDVMASLAALNSKPQGSVDLEKLQKRHEDWMRRGKKLFGKSNAPLHILQQHMETVETHNKACFNLTDQPRGPVEPQSREQTPEDGMQGHSSSSRDVFCLCRTPEAGLMIECITCHEWYV